ncbi:hypothetical protein MJ1HA_0403 [Metallosphaera sedula]|nr:hypothetical protein MJ1HA_0403 [Metallosphaera sedula]
MTNSKEKVLEVYVEKRKEWVRVGKTWIRKSGKILLRIS